MQIPWDWDEDWCSACSTKLPGDAHALDHDLNNESLDCFTKREIQLVSAKK